MNDRNAVTDDDIQRVVGGFKHYMQHAIETSSFSIDELKDFMEPIFERAGYRNSTGNSIDNILILHEGAVGDFILMSSMLRELRREYPSAYITLVVDSESKNLAEFCPYIDELLAVSFQSLKGNLTSMYFTCLNVAQNLLRHRFDAVLAVAALHFTNSPLLGYMTGARERITHMKSVWLPLITHQLTPITKKFHVVDLAVQYAEALIKHPVDNRELEVWLEDADIESAQSLLPSTKKVIAIGLVGSRAKKHYPPKSYAQLIKRLYRADSELRFVLIGGKSDSAEAALIMRDVNRKCITDLTGKTTYRQTTAILSFCRMYIGNDSSAMHLAAAVGTPVLSPNCLSLDVPTSFNVVEMFHPSGVPSVIVCPNHALAECRNSTSFYGCIADRPHCITQITPDDMFRAYNLLLERIAENNTEPLIVGTT